jgi:Zn-dependent protease with chaperone function/Zn-finger nucleic acid-binding protein
MGYSHGRITMNCPTCKATDLRPVLTKQGVEVDHCDSCGGIWLDKGEIFHFTKRRKQLANALKSAVPRARPTFRRCPKTGEALQELALFGGTLIIDYCPTNGGMWFDKGELKKMLSVDPKKLAITIEPVMGEDGERGFDPDESTQPREPVFLASLPNLGLRASMTIISLYGLLTLVLILCVELAKLPPSWALIIGVSIAVLQFFLGPWLMDLSLNWFYKMDWVPLYQLSPHLERFVRGTCSAKGMKIPRFGIIDDGGPNAFTYGHTPNNARIVVTRGLLELLDESEVEGVVAHEIGHAKNWDMFLMTVVQLVPLILYYIYRTLIQIKSGSSNNNKGSGYVALVAIVSYVLYIVCEYIVLWFSRTREYYADRFAGEVTKSPNTLSSALVKIAYGLAGQKSGKEEQTTQRSSKLDAVGAMGIFDSGMARSFALSAYAAESSSAKVTDLGRRSNILGAMKWDLWNPWAKYFELHSTHPLVANRMNHLGNQAQAMGQEPFIRFSLRRPESYWDEFFVDIMIMFLPFVAGVVLAGAALFAQIDWLYGVAFAVTGFFMLIKVGFSYPSEVFPEMSVSSLLKKVKVSGVRGIPCRLKGKVVGKGVAGLIWSEDFVLQDETGIIFLDYRQPLRLWEFFFGLMRAQDLQDAEVEIKGWYRRSPVPYIELKTLRTKQKSRECYVYTIKTLTAYLMLIGGLAATILLFFT